MKDTKRAIHTIVYVGLFLLSIIHCNAQSDTLRPYCLPIYKAWLIARDLATLDRQTILLDSAGKVIELKNIALERAQLAIQASDSAYQAKASECKECREYVNKSEALQKVELKESLKKGNKKMVVGGVLGFLVALVLL